MWTKCEICDEEFDDCLTGKNMCETCEVEDEENQHKIANRKE